MDFNSLSFIIPFQFLGRGNTLKIEFLGKIKLHCAIFKWPLISVLLIKIEIIAKKQ